MEGEPQGQPAPESPGASDAGTATAVATDASLETGATPEAATPAGTDDAGSSTAAAEETPTTERPSRRERQAARKQAAPSPEPVKSRDEIAAEIRAQDAADQAAQQRQRQEQQRYARWIGDDPADPSNPQSPTRYQQLWNEANVDLPIFPEGGTIDDLEVHNKRLASRNRAISRLQELNERRGMLGEVYGPAQQVAQAQARDWLGNEIERGLSELGLDPRKIIASITDPNVAIPTIVKSIAAAKDAEYKPQLDELEDELAAKDSEIDALRRQLGGAAPQALRGGVAATNGSMTREQFLSLPKDQKDKIRRENPGLLNDIYSRSA